MVNNDDYVIKSNAEILEQRAKWQLEKDYMKSAVLARIAAGEPESSVLIEDPSSTVPILK